MDLFIHMRYDQKETKTNAARVYLHLGLKFVFIPYVLLLDKDNMNFASI